MWYAVCIPFLIHSCAMFVDEVWFHRQRGLPLWERWGHPLDTFTVLLCYGLALNLSPSRSHLLLYLAAALFSLLFVTKDEWIHARLCSGSEQWLHACLFSLHPILLGLLGTQIYFPSSILPGYHFFRLFLIGQATVTAAFMVYQLLYWNGPWKPALPPTP